MFVAEKVLLLLVISLTAKILYRPNPLPEPMLTQIYVTILGHSELIIVLEIFIIWYSGIIPQRALYKSIHTEE